MRGHAVALYKRTRRRVWRQLENELMVHVVPDWQEHTLSATCACGPKVERPGRVLVIHNEEQC